MNYFPCIRHWSTAPVSARSDPVHPTCVPYGLNVAVRHSRARVRRISRLGIGLVIGLGTIHHRQSPVYLSEQVNTVAAQTLHSGLRSASTTNYVIPRQLTKFGELAFSHAGLTAWNSLPHGLRAASTFFTLFFTLCGLSCSQSQVRLIGFSGDP